MEYGNGDVSGVVGEFHVEPYSFVQEKQVVDAITVVEHIEFIIPEYSVEPPSLVSYF